MIGKSVTGGTCRDCWRSIYLLPLFVLPCQSWRPLTTHRCLGILLLVLRPVTRANAGDRCPASRMARR